MLRHPAIKRGDIFETKYGECKVLKYISCDKVKIKFTATNHISMVEAAKLRIGSVRDPFFPTIQGRGYLGVGPYGWGTHKRAAQLQVDILKRTCDDPKYLERHPTYKGVTICDEWLNQQTFIANIIAMPNWDNPSFQLDKDLRILGNKIYAPYSTSFIPKELNMALPNFPKGYHIDAKSGKYMPFIPVAYRTKHGWSCLVETAEEAEHMYSKYRRYRAKKLARHYKDVIHVEVYNSLMNFQTFTF